VDHDAGAGLGFFGRCAVAGHPFTGTFQCPVSEFWHRRAVLPNSLPGRAPSITNSESADSCYRRGIAALVAGAPGARAWLGEAIIIDPQFFLARVAIAAADALDGEPYTPPRPGREVVRFETQHTEIVSCVFAGRHERAADLRREHLVEYPNDMFIIWLPPRAQLR
jgi:hypothetical protein